MKYLYWVGIAFFLMLPLNFLILSVLKIVHGRPFGQEDIVGAAVGIFGLVVAFSFVRARGKRKNLG